MTEFQSFTTLIKRLEAATSRLEDLATSTASAVAVTNNLGRHPVGGQPAPTSYSVPASNNVTEEPEVPLVLAAYDEIMENSLKNFVDLSKSIGGLVEDQSHSVEDIFIAQRDFIYIATQSQKPSLSSDTFSELLKLTQQALEKVCEYRENNRPSSFFNHLSTVSEGIGALGWVTVEPRPAPYVGDLKESAQFYAHRVIQEWRDRDRAHVDWANSFIILLTELQGYVKKYHPTGLVWNPQGVDAKTFIGRKPAQAAVFAEINKGEGITASLKKVDKSQMTHKNPALRVSATVGDVGAKSHKKGPTAPPKPASLSMKKPPKTALDGNKWTIENYENDSNVMLDQAAINQTVYIYGCKNSTIQVKGKVNTVTIDSCQKTGVLLESVVAAVDVVNCKSVQLQILGKTPTIALDKTDSGQVFLSSSCLDVEILTAKCSAINVNVPEIGENGDYAERPVPEQLKSTIVDGKLVTVPVEHTG
ncbi:10682_t:CDS:2 [Paraglomus occultum]|uniref:Adenylyl cyclase-associated protein n=1 Tax=Paraglomus occultum TaxID=144539 RepID=A0A9N9EZT2_9GLOM|nr:10682_t:CDS:2 [Paraglomus occultum]